jgi:hypothetical protein
MHNRLRCYNVISDTQGMQQERLHDSGLEVGADQLTVLDLGYVTMVQCYKLHTRDAARASA